MKLTPIPDIAPEELESVQANVVYNRLTGKGEPDFPDLIGYTFTKVEKDDETLTFHRSDGRVFRFRHRQDCCESVYIESVVGDLDDLVGLPILVAKEEVSCNEDPDGTTCDSEVAESFTWTFYKFATRKGYVDVRWFGTSNGYYSEGVDFEEIT